MKTPTPQLPTCPISPTIPQLLNFSTSNAFPPQPFIKMKIRHLSKSLLSLSLVFINLSCSEEQPTKLTSPPPPNSSSADSGANTSQKQPAGQNPPLNQIIDAMKRKQAAGLGSGSLTVNSASTYTGYSVLDAVPGARLVAVDDTVTGHTPAFDFDDIEIIDGRSKMSYGSDPHITVLTPAGKVLGATDPQPKLGDPLRVLLIYGFATETENFTLYYWGKNLLLKNQNIKPSGWELPFPKKQ